MDRAEFSCRCNSRMLRHLRQDTAMEEAVRTAVGVAGDTDALALRRRRDRDRNS
jgi:hypothetical protein